MSPTELNSQKKTERQKEYENSKHGAGGGADAVTL